MSASMSGLNLWDKVMITSSPKHYCYEFPLLASGASSLGKDRFTGNHQSRIEKQKKIIHRRESPSNGSVVRNYATLRKFAQGLLCISFFVGCQGFAVHRNAIFFGCGRVYAPGGKRQFLSSTSKDRTSLNMKLRVGIVGIPNIGKSTLFNALARKSIAEASNYPFCTIDPNVAPIAIPDEYLTRLGTLADSKRTVPATIEWVDVAGLARGASRGEGLGNQFLATVRECDAICHLVRAFEDRDITHVDGKVDPIADAEVINLELLLADAAHVERRLSRTTCVGEERLALETVADGLEQGIPARCVGLSETAKFSIKSMGLLTLKPVLYAFNVDEIDFTFGREEALSRIKKIMESIQYCDPANDMFAMVSAKLEAEISVMNKEEQVEYLASLEMDLAPGEDFEDYLSFKVLPLMAKDLLGLHLAYTGPGVPPERSRTTRAWLCRHDDLTAVGMAGRLHGDIQKGFMRAEVAQADGLLEFPTYNAAKDAGFVRAEGKDYNIKTDDVVLIKWK